MSEESQSDNYTGVFCTGVKNLFGRHMWAVIKKRVVGEEELTPYLRLQLRGVLDVPDPSITKFDNGALSDKLLYAFITELKMSMSAFDALPSRDECAFAGFRYLIYKLEGGKKPYPDEKDQIDIHLFLALVRIIRVVRERRSSPADWTDREWDDICREFIPTLPGRGEVLRMHYEEHAEYIAQSIDMVKYKWMSDDAN